MTIKTQTSWAEQAARFNEALQELYWNAETCLYENSHPAQPSDEIFHYWWQAHALDCLVDAFERTAHQSFLVRAEQLLQGVLKRNNGTIINDYYDDMQWMALALLGLYDATKNKTYLTHVQTLWQDIQKGWNGHCGGGIAWRKMQLDYKNTPANAPAVILGARLYQRLKQRQHLEFALKIYAWLQANLVDPATGFIWDGMNRLGDGKIDKDWAFTYCQGVMIGAGLELFRATRDDDYIKQAQQTMQAALERLCNERGTLPDEGAGDGGLFKGILVRYLGMFLLEHPQELGLEVLEQNGQLLAIQDQAVAGTNWEVAPEGHTDLSVALSAVMLLETMARLEKAKMLSGKVK